MQETTLFFLAQSVIIIGAVIAAYVGTKVSIARLEEKVEMLKVGHAGRDRKIDGMSRRLAELSGQVNNVSL